MITLERTKSPAKELKKIRLKYYIYNNINKLQRLGNILGGILDGSINRANKPERINPGPLDNS